MPHYDPEKHHRRSIRLQGYDYSQEGLYFITICCQNRACLFGEITNGEMIVNEAGKMVESEWLKLKKRFPNIEYHEYVVMPNHFHAILEIVGATLVVAPVEIEGQPQGIAPTVEGIAPTEEGIAPTVEGIAPTEIGMDLTNVGATLVVAPVEIEGQPQGIAPTKEGIAPTVEGIAPTKEGIAPTEEGIAPTNKTIGDIIGAFKSITTVEYIQGVKTLDWQPFDGKLWQRNYYEHIIRNEASYQRITEYIINNPIQGDKDKF